MFIGMLLRRIATYFPQIHSLYLSLYFCKDQNALASSLHQTGLTEPARSHLTQSFVLIPSSQIEPAILSLLAAQAPNAPAVG